MAFKCDNCGKGVAHGHAVSHAKNRTKRLFKPNLQKLKVLKNGLSIRVKFCTSCIQRLKRDGRFGGFTYRKYVPKKEEVKLPKKEAVLPKVEKKEVVPEMDISQIVGKKSSS